MKKPLQALLTLIVIVAAFLCISCAANIGPHGASVVVDPSPSGAPPPPTSGPPPPAYQQGPSYHHPAPNIPQGHMPPPGKCRIWYQDLPPGQQPPPGNCYDLERRVPPGTWLIRG